MYPYYKFFSITQAISDGITKYFKNLRFFIPIGLITSLVLTGLYFLFQNFGISFSEFNAFNTFADYVSENLKLIFESIKNKTEMHFYLDLNLGMFSINIFGFLVEIVYFAFLANFCLKLYNNKISSFADFFKLDFNLLNVLLFSI